MPNEHVSRIRKSAVATASSVDLTTEPTNKPAVPLSLAVWLVCRFNEHTSMEYQRFRLVKPTMGFCVNVSEKSCIAVPAGAVVELPPTILSNERFVDVKWEGRSLVMFLQDVRERGTALAESES